MKLYTLALIGILTFMTPLAWADVIVCHSTYIFLSGEQRSSEPGPDLSVEIDSQGNAFGNVTGSRYSIVYSASLKNNEGVVGLSLSDNKNTVAVFGDLSVAGKNLRLVFGDAILKAQGIIDITCTRQERP